MIQVKVDYSKDRIQSFTVSGHAQYAKKGQDIVCAGVTAVAFGSVNAITKLTGAKLDIKQGGKGGFLQVKVPDLDQGTDEKVQLLLEAMLVSMKTIEIDYGQYMKMILNK